MTKKDVLPSVDYKLPDDWRGEVMSRIRELIKEANPEIFEDVKYKTASNPGGVLVWYYEGMICTGEVYKKHLRLTFVKGPALKVSDPKGILNSFRSATIQEGDKLDETAFKNLIRAAAELNGESKKGKK